MRIAFDEDWRWEVRRPWRLPRILWDHVVWFCQRGWRGYSDLDVNRSLSLYLCQMLPDALRDMGECRGPGQLTQEQWKRRLDCMADGLGAAVEVMERAESLEAEKRLVRRFKRGWLLIGKWFWWL